MTSLSADLLDGLTSASFLRSTGKAADAEKVDGINGASIALTTGRTGVVYGSDTDVDQMAITARCPAGSIATGGGGAPTSRVTPWPTAVRTSTKAPAC